MMKRRVTTAVLAAGGALPEPTYHHLGDHTEALAAAHSASDLEASLASTAAARLNAYVSGFGDEATLAAAARELGWDVAALRRRLDETPD